MRKLAALVLLASFILHPFQASATVKAGDSCKKVGQTATASNKKFTCVKSGKKLVWNKGVALPKPSPVATPTPTATATATPIPLKPIESPKEPSTKEFLSQGNLPVDNCKIKQTTNFLHRSFNYIGGVALKPDSIIQVIGLQAQDSLSKGSPASDYAEFIAEIKDYVRNLSDGNWNLQVRITDSYLMLPSSLESYEVGIWDLKGDDRTTGQENLIKAGTSLISAQEANSASMFMFVFPLDTSANLHVRFSNTFQITLGQKSSVKVFSIVKTDLAWGTVHHDFFHLGLLIPDHYGDEKYQGQNFTQFIGSTGEIIGTDRWGNMSGTNMDWLGWDKWIGGFMKDSQVLCAKVEKAEIFWVKPSAVFGASNKLLVVPTGLNTAIVVESMRNVGYNSSLPSDLMGALVYSIDLTKSDFGSGFNVIRPIDRLEAKSNSRQPGNDALRVGDFINFGGYKISVVEAGAYGDLVKVEKIN